MKTSVVLGVSFLCVVCLFWLSLAFRLLGEMMNFTRDQLKYFVSNRLDATSGWGGTVYKHQCSCLCPFCGSATHLWGEAKALCGKNSEANWRGTLWGVGSTMIIPGFWSFREPLYLHALYFSSVQGNLEFMLHSWSYFHFYLTDTEPWCVCRSTSYLPVVLHADCSAGEGRFPSLFLPDLAMVIVSEVL